MGEPTEEDSHYTAHVEIKLVKHSVPAVPGARPPIPKQERVVHEITDIVLKSSTLEKLKSKLAGHIDLIEVD